MVFLKTKPARREAMKASLFESSGLKADYQAALVEPWSPYLGAVLLLLDRKSVV